MEYKLELSVEDLEKGAKILEKIKNKIPRIKTKLLNAYADFMIQQMKMYVPIETGNLQNSISKELIDESTIEVFVNEAMADYAMFVEFGTGIVGANSPHTQPSINWQYDTKKHGYKGWIYYDKAQARVRFTKGQVASEFLYKAYQDLEASYLLIAQKIFKEEGLYNE